MAGQFLPQLIRELNVSSIPSQIRIHWLLYGHVHCREASIRVKCVDRSVVRTNTMPARLEQRLATRFITEWRHCNVESLKELATFCISIY